MQKILNSTKEEQEILFTRVAQEKGMVPAIIEKDFWVCFMLDFLFNKFEYSNKIVFKGGTSLSKAYGVIERFSKQIPY